jgi:predicted RNase H-like HicB family nuclease
MDHLNYPIVIYPSDEGGFVAEVPALKGCLAQGETMAETLEELDIVKQLWLETAQKHGKTLPDVTHAIERVKALSYSRST